MDYSTYLSKAKQNITINKNVQRMLASFQSKNKAGTLTYDDALRLAEALSKAGAVELKKIVPLESELGAFAEQFVSPLYETMQRTTLNASKQVQTSLLKRNGLNLTAADVKEDASRLEHIVQRFKEASEYEEVSFLLGEDVATNICKSAVHDTIRQNASSMSSAGFKTKVTRSDGAGCCEWCSSMVGTYEIGKLPENFWGVHKGCSCSFDYETKDRYDRVRFTTNSDGSLSKTTESYSKR